MIKPETLFMIKPETLLKYHLLIFFNKEKHINYTFTTQVILKIPNLIFVMIK